MNRLCLITIAIGLLTEQVGEERDQWDLRTFRIMTRGQLKFLGTLYFGKLKESFIYEMVGDAANLQQQERILSRFFVSRNIGLRLTNTMAAERMTWAVGWFNDWWVEGQHHDESGNTVVGRLTGLPYMPASGDRFVQLASTLSRPRERDRPIQRPPESNTASYYVDWWATRRWKIGADCGLTELDRFGKSGTTRSLHMRIQWIY
jgi:hypothetical protein